MGNFSLARNRIRLLILFTAVIMFLFGIRLVQVRALQANDYRSRAVNEMAKVKTLQAPRGGIADINGLPFARSAVAAISIVVDQTQISNPAKTAAFCCADSWYDDFRGTDSNYW
jgi:cell division protein FtsI (penicillin-binding protein 3)